MPLIDTIKRFLLESKETDGTGSDNQSETPAEHEDILSSQLGTDAKSLRVNRLSGVIQGYYEVSHEDAELLAKTVKKGLEEGVGYSKLARQAEDDGVQLPRDEILTIIWTEKAGYRTRDSVKRFSRRDIPQEVEWIVPEDHDDVCPVCRDISEEIKRRGGSVSLQDLQSILCEKAQEYEEGTPERAEDWIPHERCKSALAPSI